MDEMYEKELKFATETAKYAGYLLRHYFSNFSENQKLQVDFIDSSKGLVSEADITCDKKIREEIKRVFPKYNIISEEEKSLEQGNEFTWIFDPLDGTNNFANRIPFFATSLALAKKDEVIVAATYLPIQDELFYSVKGQGAYYYKNDDFNKRKISVSDKPLDRAIISFDSNHHKPSEEENLRIMKVLYKREVFRTRIFNAAVIEMAYVADSRGEACIYQGSNLWDLAAGALLVQEAGGKVTDFQGKPWTIKSDSIIASNGKIHSELEELLSKEFN